MKKLLLIAITAVTAQTATAQVSFAPELGLQMTKVTGKSGGSKDKTDLKAGLRVGANVDMGITNNFHISAGLFYSGMGGQEKGLVEDFAGTMRTVTVKTVFDYLQLPVYFNAMTGETGGNRFFAGLGPYLGYTLAARIKVQDISQKIPLGSEYGEYKRMDLGLNFNAGFMLSMGIYARAFYSLGLSNNLAGGDSKNSLRNSGFGLSLGYNFQL